MLGCAPSTHLKNEGVTRHPGVCKHTWLIGVHARMWNICRLSRMGGEVCEQLRKRMMECRRRDGEDRVLGHRRWNEGDISCGDL